MGLAVGEQDIVFYADDDSITGRNTIWVQGTMTSLIQVFERVEIDMNLGKTNPMTCISSFIWGEMGKKAYMRRSIGEGATFREIKQTQVSCNKCCVTMSESSLRHSLASIHGRSLDQNQDVDTGGGRGRKTYMVSFPQVLMLVAYLLQGYPERAHTLGKLQEISCINIGRLKWISFRMGRTLYHFAQDMEFTCKHRGLSGTRE